MLWGFYTWIEIRKLKNSQKVDQWENRMKLYLRKASCVWGDVEIYISGMRHICDIYRRVPKVERLWCQAYTLPTIKTKTHKPKTTSTKTSNGCIKTSEKKLLSVRTITTHLIPFCQELHIHWVWIQQSKGYVWQCIQLSELGISNCGLYSVSWVFDQWCILLAHPQ
jgi:hypothetical protein